MNTERLVKQGRLRELEATRRELSINIDGNVKAVKALLALSSVTPVEQLDLESALTSLDEALKKQRELKAVKADIAKIEDEL